MLDVNFDNGIKFDFVELFGSDWNVNFGTFGGFEARKKQTVFLINADKFSGEKDVHAKIIAIKKKNSEKNFKC